MQIFFKSNSNNEDDNAEFLLIRLYFYSGCLNFIIGETTEEKDRKFKLEVKVLE